MTSNISLTDSNENTISSPLIPHTEEQEKRVDSILQNMCCLYTQLLEIGHPSSRLRVPKTDNLGDEDYVCDITFSVDHGQLSVSIDVADAGYSAEDVIGFLERAQKAMNHTFILLNHSGTKH